MTDCAPVTGARTQVRRPGRGEPARAPTYMGAGVVRAAADDNRAPAHPSAAPGFPNIDAFEERAAIAEHGGGLTRAEAERMAAEAQGFADPVALCGAAVDGWRHNLEALALRETSKRGQDCIAAALRFIEDGWAEKAAALGWPEVEIFGTDQRAPLERLDRIGAAYSPFTPSAVTAECLVYPGTGRTPMRRWRSSQADGAALPWKAAP